MKLFWTKKKKSEEIKVEPQEEETAPKNPYITFELVDGVHLEITIEWPLEGSIDRFTKVLALLNSGQLINPQITEAALYANKVNQPDKAIAIHAVLSQVTTGGKKEKVASDRPLVLPSKFFPNQLKYHSH